MRPSSCSCFIAMLLASAGCGGFLAFLGGGISEADREVKGPNPVGGGELTWSYDYMVNINCSDERVPYAHVLSARPSGEICYRMTDYGYTGNPARARPITLENPAGRRVTIPMQQSAGPADMGACDKRPEWRYARVEFEGCAPAAGFLDASTSHLTTRQFERDAMMVKWTFAPVTASR
jgi:hypothetical protein